MNSQQTNPAQQSWDDAAEEHRVNWHRAAGILIVLASAAVVTTALVVIVKSLSTPLM